MEFSRLMMMVVPQPPSWHCDSKSCHLMMLPLMMMTTTRKMTIMMMWSRTLMLMTLMVLMAWMVAKSLKALSIEMCKILIQKAFCSFIYFFSCFYSYFIIIIVAAVAVVFVVISVFEAYGYKKSHHYFAFFVATSFYRLLFLF